MSLPSSRRVALRPREALGGAEAAGSARIVQARHKRLVVTYGVRDAVANVTPGAHCHGHQFNSFQHHYL
jgi:hypothetical protein